jgi:hypothetical protein
LRASERVARGQVEALTYSLDVLATAPAAGQVPRTNVEHNRSHAWSPKRDPLAARRIK